jgi:hypothetical protein
MITIKEEFVGGVKWRKAIKLGGADVILLWLAMKRYAAETLSNGFVPDEELDALPGVPERPREALEALLGCGKTLPDGSRGSGLIDPHPHGWQLHDYLDHANSAEQEAVRKARERERKANYRAGLKTGQSHGTDAGQTNGTVRGTAHAASHVRPRTHTPARTNPTQPNPTDQDPTTTSNAEPSGANVEPAAGALVVVVGDTRKISCPGDLRMTDGQRSTMITALVPEWAIEPLELSFRMNFQGKPSDLRTREVWQQCMGQWCMGRWNDPNKRPPKPGTEGGTHRGQELSPRGGDQLAKQLRKIDAMGQDPEPAEKVLAP